MYRTRYQGVRGAEDIGGGCRQSPVASAPKKRAGRRRGVIGSGGGKALFLFLFLLIFLAIEEEEDWGRGGHQWRKVAWTRFETRQYGIQIIAPKMVLPMSPATWPTPSAAAGICTPKA